MNTSIHSAILDALISGTKKASEITKILNSRGMTTSEKSVSAVLTRMNRAREVTRQDFSYWGITDRGRRAHEIRSKEPEVYSSKDFRIIYNWSVIDHETGEQKRFINHEEACEYCEKSTNREVVELASQSEAEEKKQLRRMNAKKLIQRDIARDSRNVNIPNMIEDMVKRGLI